MINNSELSEAKDKLDSLIGKSRILMYKPIQIAEILYMSRIEKISIKEIESQPEKYRNPSKKWRDIISVRLFNQVCTSSQKFQDNIFENNAMIPHTIAILAEHNNEKSGIVERYIYQQIAKKQSTVCSLISELHNAKPETFELETFLSKFSNEKGIKRSIDQCYEAVVYSLFDTLVTHLEINVRVEANKSKSDLLMEFEDFTRVLINIDSENRSITVPAKIYRAGVTNAADKGLDMWANFGPAIQVKHLSLTEELAEDIVDSIAADQIIIVCKDVEINIIKNLCTQLGFKKNIQGIITKNDLIKWYNRALRGKYAHILAKDLLLNLRLEFGNGFPYSETLIDFYNERKYNLIGKIESPFYDEEVDIL